MLAQLNPTVGDLQNNAKKLLEAYFEARSAKVNLVAFPEMFLTGYQAQDLVTKEAFLDDVSKTLSSVAASISGGPPLVVGAPSKEGDLIYNAYFLLFNGCATVVSRKHHLPNDDIFDEKRVFASGPISGPYSIGAHRIGSPICEDFWYEDVAETLVETGADLLLAPNGSPYARDKMSVRMNVMVKRSLETKIPLIYLNMVGGQDDQIFDGGSFVLNPGGKLAIKLPQFEEVLQRVDFEQTNSGLEAKVGLRVAEGEQLAQDYRAMVEALRDYVIKSEFSQVILGLSGGVDSALVAAIACDAIGPQNVLGVRLPSSISSQSSLDDASELVSMLGCRVETIPIISCQSAVSDTLGDIFSGFSNDITEENIQSRIRGLLLMALSNKFGSMLLTTGNKSEVAVGYSTIYGDMAGGYNPIKDLYKTRVFKTCEWRNYNFESWMLGARGLVIPVPIIEKPPSAELSLGQRDDDTLPPYDILDPILENLIENDMSINEIVQKGFDTKTVQKIESLVYGSEYKRFQSAPGPHLTEKSFWLSRRYPLIQKWRDPS